MLHVHNKDTESTIQLLWRNINKIFIYIEKGSISCFLCVVNLFNEARKGYRFSRVYLLRFSKGQFEPCDIHLNNNNIGRRVWREGGSVADKERAGSTMLKSGRP